jgi:drug/metabolite transporter (DMT)-like permease
MPELSSMGITLALASAVVWGSGDFSGGVAARRSSQFHVLALAALSGLVMLILIAVVRREALPGPADTAWAAGAGVGGAIGIAALYRGLSLGSAATVAPTAAVVGASVPVIFSALVQGLPGPAQLAGFAVAAGGLWLVSRPAGAGQVGHSGAKPELVLALIAGLGFGSFFILIAQVRPGLVFTPLVVARSMALMAALFLLRARRLGLPGLRSNPVALLAGLLDAGGNMLYVMAQQYTRLDVAAVLSSLYPAATVVLAALLLKERVSRPQWLGAALCLAAVMLIAG